MWVFVFEEEGVDLGRIFWGVRKNGLFVGFYDEGGVGAGGMLELMDRMRLLSISLGA